MGYVFSAQSSRQATIWNELTLTLTALVLVPAVPTQLNVYVVVTNGVTVALPDTGIAKGALPLMLTVQEVAPGAAHRTMDGLGYVTKLGVAVALRVSVVGDVLSSHCLMLL